MPIRLPGGGWAGEAKREAREKKATARAAGNVFVEGGLQEGGRKTVIIIRRRGWGKERRKKSLFLPSSAEASANEEKDATRPFFVPCLSYGFQKKNNVANTQSAKNVFESAYMFCRKGMKQL